MKNPNYRHTLLALALAVAIGCSSTPKIEEFADTANPAQELQSFTADLNSAVESQVNVLSPAEYEQAARAQKSAERSQDKGRDAKETLHAVAVGRAHLTRANQFSQLAKTNLEAVVNARQAAIDAGAPKAFSEEFTSADEDLKSVTSEIENNDLSSVAESKDKLQKQYLDVELKAITASNLGPAKDALALALKEGASEYAQQSLAITKKNIDDTEMFIFANRHDTSGVTARSKGATAAANHLLKITRASKAGRNVSSEQTALQIESEQIKTQNERDQLAQERETAKGLAAETVNLKSDAAFIKNFEAARREFTKSEAEVYTQGKNLVIRLRALEFPANQAVIKGSNFALLSKVAKVVKGFDNASVVIEGHTDSDGGKELNDKLSAERAQAFSDYLVSNNAIEAERISVAGYGFQRPLASNKTAKGKAQNRRVDVIITPAG
jgi:OmpA-OmpF porin, OOP family